MAAHHRGKVDRERTAVHEAGHAVVQWATGIGLISVTILRDYREMSVGHAVDAGEYPEEGSDADTLRTFAQDAFWLRHAIARLAGAEAVRQLRSRDAAEHGAGDDQRWTIDALNRITDEKVSLDLYLKLAKRRCVLLVEHYRPEIELEQGTTRRRRARVGHLFDAKVARPMQPGCEHGGLQHVLQRQHAAAVRLVRASRDASNVLWRHKDRPADRRRRHPYAGDPFRHLLDVRT